ncbi:serine protease Do [Streptohalobacillus salinus]|uniref:Serine protease Do n=1 Tax=Streptohalobacillus salinus TaxID=621096 RepID=A0A2V3WC51_9BACI|nr:trypsin-like peptidase domain-containing protein [Streptohalobacillus salinus]PXW89775.1 serine protease Do [Streptohalobacillus salinus]
MVYFDDGTRKKRYRYKRREHKLLALLLAFIAGAFMFAVLLPFIIDQGFLPYHLTREATVTPTKQTNHQSILSLTGNITDIVERVMPTVVGIENNRGNAFLLGEQTGGTGSGVIYKQTEGTAYIITNQHVIEGATELTVVLSNGERLDATLIGEDVFTDLAVVTVDSQYVEAVISFGDSEAARVGEDVLAIGNPLGLDLSGSVTKGIISGKDRMIPVDLSRDGLVDWQVMVMQTDAAINPGNSGGALVNRHGELIGINSMKIAESSIEGIGFTIPINEAIPVIDQLEADGQMNRAFLGIEAYPLATLTETDRESRFNLPEAVRDGVYLERVVEGSPAANAGLQQNDVIVKLDETDVNSMIALRQYLYSEKAPGETMEVTYYRDQEEMTTSVELSTQE